MKIIKSALALFSAVVIFAVGIIPASASFENVYITNKTDFATPVEDQGSEDDCLYYSVLSAAGSFVRKYYGLSETQADFSEANLKKAVGLNYDIHNFGEILYKSVGCDIGDGYFITSVEMLSGRGRRYIQEKIKENSAVVAAIAMPKDGDMKNESYYNSENNSFFCPLDCRSNEKYHAITIVGWDEDYSWSNFSTEPDYMGAWICKNSYGEGFGDGGYFYLSYDYDFVYAASLEVTNMSGLSFVYPSNQVFKYLGYVNGICVRAFENNITDNITVTVGEKTAFSGDVNLKNGYTLIQFDKPFAAGEINVEGNKISTSMDTIYCYWSLLPKKVPMNVANIDTDETWLETVERILIDIDPYNYYACDTYDVNFHNVTYNSNDNCIYITPCDGYRFDKNVTFIDRIDGFYGFKKGTISNVTEKFPQTIRYDDGADGRGRIIVTGHSIGGAKITDINIVTDEEGMFSFALCTFDNGSLKTIGKEKLNINMYSDSECQNEITTVEGLNEYYLKISDLPQNTTEKVSISVNGEKTDITMSEESEIIIKITIPDIEMKLGVFFGRISEMFIKLRSIFKIYNE